MPSRYMDIAAINYVFHRKNATHNPLDPYFNSVKY